MNKLASEHCVPVNAASPLIKDDEANDLLRDLDGWTVYKKDGEPRLEKSFKFDDFKQALEFTQRVGLLADEENHHPALLTEWGRVTVYWWTHKIRGLHRNDFIMAAKTEELNSTR